MAGTTQLPPGCSGANCVTAIANGSYPQVFNNVTVDPSFGVTSPLYLKQITPSGLPAGRHPGADERADHQLLVEVGGQGPVSTDGRDLTRCIPALWPYAATP